MLLLLMELAGIAGLERQMARHFTGGGPQASFLGKTEPHPLPDLEVAATKGGARRKTERIACGPSQRRGDKRWK